MAHDQERFKCYSCENLRRVIEGKVHHVPYCAHKSKGTNWKRHLPLPHEVRKNEGAYYSYAVINAEPVNCPIPKIAHISEVQKERLINTITDNSEVIANMQKRIDELEQENLELIAHCEDLRKVIFLSLEADEFDLLEKALNKTPSQSLCDIKNNAIAEHNIRLVDCLKFTATYNGLNYLVVSADDILDNAQQLKEQANETNQTSR